MLRVWRSPSPCRSARQDQRDDHGPGVRPRPLLLVTMMPPISTTIGHPHRYPPRRAIVNLRDVQQPGGVLGGRYELREKIGQGGFGEVWRAWDRNRSHEVALKLLFRGRPADAWVEASLLTQLNSPYILEVHNADVIVDVPFLDTALAQTSLDRLSAPRGVEPHFAVEATRRALRGLALCHSRGLLHRDVKPANIFRQHNGDIVLGDFGAAQLMDADGLAPAAGDPRVRAPETYESGRQGVRADIYGAAVSLFVMLAGRWPFEHSMQADLDYAITHGERPALRELAPHVSVALAGVVEKGMHLDVDNRFPTAADFDSALGKLPVRTNRFTPILERDGHERCWSVEGKSHLHVCVCSDTALRVEVTHKKSGRKVARLGGSCPASRLATTLRTTFDQLRKT